MDRQMKAKILVVDDDAVMLARYALEDEGFEVVVALDGQTGLDIVTTQENVDLIVLDLKMPGMTGYEVCSQIREQLETADLPVVMLTASAGEQDRFTGLVLAEADAYLTKPASPAELVETVRSVLDRSTISGQ